MSKTEFLTELKKALEGLPEEDIEKSLEYYSEMIDDRIEDGLSEEEAVAEEERYYPSVRVELK